MTRVTPGSCRSSFDSAIGGHYRHCLDHFQCLLEGLRRRRSELRSSPARSADRKRSRILRSKKRGAFARVSDDPAGALDLPINVCSKVSYVGEDPR